MQSPDLLVAAETTAALQYHMKKIMWTDSGSPGMTGAALFPPAVIDS